MEMTPKEKDILFSQIINEHFFTQKNSSIFIPVEHLTQKGLDISDANNVLWRLKDDGILKSYKHCWGFLEIKRNKKTFVFTSSEEPKTDDDFEVYEMEVVPGKLTQALKAARPQNEISNKTILYLAKNGDLYREPKDSFCYPMSGKGVPLRIVKYFMENPNTDYEQDTASLANAIDIKTEQLRKEINKMRVPIKNGLKLNAVLFEGRRNSGYRLNPSIEILPKN